MQSGCINKNNINKHVKDGTINRLISVLYMAVSDFIDKRLHTEKIHDNCTIDNR